MPHLQHPPPSSPLLLPSPLSSLSLWFPLRHWCHRLDSSQAFPRVVLCLTNEWMELLLHKEGEEFVYSC